LNRKIKLHLHANIKKEQKGTYLYYPKYVLLALYKYQYKWSKKKIIAIFFIRVFPLLCTLEPISIEVLGRRKKGRHQVFMNKINSPTAAIFKRREN